MQQNIHYRTLWVAERRGRAVDLRGGLRHPRGMRSVLVLAVLLPAACSTPASGPSASASPTSEFGVRVTAPPYDEVHASYKERLEQPYVFAELRGSYTRTGRALEGLHAALKERGLVASGPPFALYFDDPGRVPESELRSRACFPVDVAPHAITGVPADVLPRAHVVYAVVRGPYPEVPRAYPGLYGYLGRMGWVEAGPIREIYLVPPTAVADFGQLLCEVQIPAAVAR
jgi:effector-binding domain-containing protein